MTVQSSFLSKVKPFCYGCWIEYGILPSVAAAQTALESNWGRSGLSSKYNNYHGIKAVAGYPSVSLSTKEDYGSGLVTVTQKFAHFPSPAGSFNYYGSMLKRRYKVSGTKDAYTAIKKIKAGGYATDTQYVSKIMSTINSNGLQKWDKDALAGGKGGYNGSFENTSAGSGDGEVELPQLVGQQFRTFNNNFIKKNNYTRPKTKLKGVNGIVVHDAGSKGLSAASVRSYLNKGGASRKDGGLHIIVDKTNTVCIVPLDEKVYHANGKNQSDMIKASDANDVTLSVGLCRENDGSYSEKTLARALAVVSELVNAYGFPVEAVLREYDVNGAKNPINWVENQFDYSTFLGLVEYQKNQNTPLLNEDLEKYYEALAGGGSSGASGGDFGDYRAFTGDFNKVSNKMGVYDYLYDLGEQVVKKFKGKYPTVYISNGKRKSSVTAAGTVSDHVTGQGLDIACGGVYGPRYLEMAKTLAGHPYVKYVIGSNMWNPGNVKTFKTFPYGGHMNHLHISVNTPAEAKKAGQNANKGKEDSESLPSTGDIDITKGYALKITKTTTAYKTDSDKATTEKKYSSGNILRVLSIGMHSYRVDDDTWIKKDQAGKNYKLFTTGGIDKPIGSVVLTANVEVKTRPSYSSPNYLENGRRKTISKGSRLNVHSKENGMFRISTNDNYRAQQWIAATYCNFDNNLKEVEAPSGSTGSGGSSGGSSGGGNTGNIKGKSITVSATAYTANCAGCSGITATGVDVRKKTPNIIAVDPKVIPLHSQVYIPALKEKFFAEDTGGAIKGKKIDILVASNSEALRWGRRNIEVIILDNPAKDPHH